MPGTIKPDDSSQLGSLRGQFLIAMPGLNDSIFSHTVTFICDHNDDGAMGLVINQPLGIDMSQVFEQLECDTQAGSKEDPVYCGGPVQPERGFILHRPGSQWESSLQVTDNVILTASRDIIEAIAQNKGPDQYLTALGYAGWGAGQLEQEISENSWLTVPADSAIIFEIPAEQRWAAASRQLGIDLNLISTTAGHA